MFLACMDIIAPPGGPVLHLYLGFSTPDYRCSGVYQITSADNPDIRSGHAYGTWHPLVPRNSMPMAVTGSDVPPGSNMVPNLEFQLVTPGTEPPMEGHGRFRYRQQDGSWTPWIDGTVQMVPCNTIDS